MQVFLQPLRKIKKDICRWRICPCDKIFTNCPAPYLMSRVLLFCFLLFFIVSPISYICFAAADTTDDDAKTIRLEIFSPPENAAFHFIVVEKDRQRLTLFRQRGHLETVLTLVCATGENPGNKLASGDSRTPEGIYFITEIYEDSKITVFGSRAFHLDYPNFFDTHAGRLGDGIFIHGTNKKLVPNSTNGCITLNNRDLEDLAPYLVVNHLPVIVVNSLHGNKEEMAVSLSPTDPQFTRIIQLLSLTDEHVATERISTLYFLQVGSQAVASIKYNEYDGSTLRLSYQKRSYLAAGHEKPWRILQSHHFQEPHPLILAKQPSKKRDLPVIAASTPENNVPAKEPTKQESLEKPGEELLSFVERWRKSWENKDLNAYMACYAPTFTSGKLNKEAWRKKKSYLNKKYRYIKVSIRNIIVEWTKDGANVSFHQQYSSDQYRSTGTKVLKLLRQNDKWLINREMM